MNRNQAIKIIVGLLLFVSSSLAVSEDWTFVADTQRFGVRLFLVPDADAFIEMWSKPEPPKITLFSKAKINTQFAGAILYWGGGIDENGNCNIQLQAQVLEKGKVLARGPEMPVCQDHAPPPSGVLALSDTMTVLITSGEPANLMVQVTVTDKINNEKLLVKAPIEVLSE